MKLRHFLIVFFVVVIFQTGIYPVITSRIECTVLDKDTGQPIIGASVTLIPDLDNFKEKRGNLNQDLPVELDKNTDSQGVFRFNNLLKGEYYICIFKEGYENYGPFIQFPGYLSSMEQININKYITIMSVKPNIRGRIYLEEGENKHIDIKLGKEAILEIRYTKKTPGRVEPLDSSILPNITGYPDIFKNFKSIVTIDNLDPFFNIYPTKKEKGLEVYRYLPGSKKIHVEVWATGYPAATYEILLENGKTSVIDYVLDYTKGPVIHGIIKDKTTGEPIRSVNIKVLDNSNNWYSTNTDFKGEYWLTGFKPGKITIRISYYKKMKKYLEYRDILDKEILEFNREF